MVNLWKPVFGGGLGPPCPCPSLGAISACQVGFFFIYSVCTPHRGLPTWSSSTSHRKYAQNLPKAALLRALRGPHFPKEPEVLSTPSEFFGALRAQHITPHPLASGGRARRTFQFSDLVGVEFFALNQAARTWTISLLYILINISLSTGDETRPVTPRGVADRAAAPGGGVAVTGSGLVPGSSSAAGPGGA